METSKSTLGLMIRENEATLVAETACRAGHSHCL